MRANSTKVEERGAKLWELRSAIGLSCDREDDSFLMSDRRAPAKSALSLVADKHDCQDVARNQRGECQCTEKFVHCRLFLTERIEAPACLRGRLP